jgi:thiol-disulfide isomerase/thioredoxin
MNQIARLVFGIVTAMSAGACLAAVKTGDVPPDYLGTDFRDGHVAVSDFKGKVVVVTFWASWCPPCRREMGVLESIQKTAGHQAIEVVAVNFKEDNAKWTAMKRQLAGFDLRITRDKTWKVTEAFGVKNIPHMFMIDRSGHVAHIHVGYGEKALDSLVKEINELLAQPAH